MIRIIDKPACVYCMCMSEGKSRSDKAKALAKLLVELGTLKLIPRSGWLKIGIKHPESVAEHSFRTAVIAYVLARLDGIDVKEACTIAFLALLHDSHEARTLDLHRLAKKYARIDEERAKREQLSELDIEELFCKLEKSGISKDEAENYVKDADNLELLIQAREYSMLTNLAKNFEVDEGKLKTGAGKIMHSALKEVELKWWDD